MGNFLELPAIRGAGETAVPYYLICALGFALAGLVVGYFIWRRGHHQTLDAESEVHRASANLETLRKEMEREAQALGDAPAAASEKTDP